MNFRERLEQEVDITRAFFHKDGMVIHYATWGHGTHMLLAFHGFGRNHKVFIPFSTEFHSHFRFCAIDIFFHGESTIGKRSPDSDPLKEHEFKSLIEAFLAHLHCEKVWLMGHSLGGRLVMKIAEIMPKRVGGLYLFAPDGLVVNRWYVALSHNAPGRAAFKFLKKKNSHIIRFVNLMRKTGMVNERMAEFAIYYASSEEVQMQGYNTWTFLRKLDPVLPKLTRALHTHKIPTDLYMGHYDALIPLKNAKRITRLHPEIKVHVLSSAHRLLTPNIARQILDNGWMQLPEDFGS